MQGLVGAVFEGIGVSTGSYIGGLMMERFQGSTTFRIFSFGAFAFFGIHVMVQWLLTKFTGPYGKKSTMNGTDENSDKMSNETLEVNKNEGRKEALDDGFKDIDLTQ